MEYLTIGTITAAECNDQPKVMNNEWSRYLSFLNFPEDSCLMPTRLAQAGFYYTGSGVKVICFFCGIQNETWTEDETVKDVHRRLSPHCRYICGDDTSNIPMHGQGSMMPVPKCLKESNTCKYNKQKQNGSQVEHSADVKEEELSASNGIFKTSNHIHQPNLKGATDIAYNSTISEKNIEAPNKILKTDNMSTHNSEKQRLLDENRTLRDLTTCKVCFSNDACVAVLPCGHLASCVECSKSLRKCVVCGTVTQATVRVYQA